MKPLIINLKKAILGCICLIFHLPSSVICAQVPFVIDWSGPIKMKRNDIGLRVVHADSSGIYCTHNTFKSWEYGIKVPTIDRIGWDLNLRSSQTLEKYISADSVLFRDFLTNSKAQFVLESVISEKKNGKVVISHFDFKTLSAKPGCVLVDSIDSDRIKEGKENFFWDFEGNRFYFGALDLAKGFGISMYNTALKKLWWTYLNLEFEPSRTRIRSGTVTLSGKVILVFEFYGQPYGGAEEQIRHPVNFVDVLFVLESNNSSAKMYFLDAGKPFYSDFEIVETSDGLLHLIGLYSDKFFNSYNGIVEFVIDPFTDKIEINGPIAFPESIVQRYSDDKEPSDEGIKNLRSRGCIIDNKYHMLTELTDEYDRYGYYDYVLWQVNEKFDEIKGVPIEKSITYNLSHSVTMEPGLSNLISLNGNYYIIYNKNLLSKGEKMGLCIVNKENQKQIFSIAPPADQEAYLVTFPCKVYNGKIIIIAESMRHDTYYIGVLSPDRS